jgi:hypothetical protein
VKKILYLASALVAVSCYGSTAYVTDGAGQFGTMDLGTGVFNQIGGEEPSLLYGLGWEGGVLYGLDTNSDPNLVTIDPITGAINTVGATGLAPRSILSAISGGSLYALDGVTSDLYSIAPSTGAATLVGSTSLPANLGSNYDSMAGDTANLYVSVNQTLYIVNPANGNTTVVGSLPNSLVLGAAAMDNQLYAFSGAAGQPFYTVDTGNAQGTFVADAQVAVFFAASDVPEPGTEFLLGLGLVAVAAARRPVTAKSSTFAG